MIKGSWRYPVLRTIFHILSWIVMGSRRRLHVQGLDNVPRTGPVILVGNHIATLDPPMVTALLPRLDIHAMAKSEAFRRRFARFMLHSWNTFPIVRHSADRRALGRALQVLREGHVLALFPEGTRSKDAQLSRAFPGAGFIALHSGAPVIPVAIWGSEDVLPKGRYLPNSAHVHVRYGEPITLERRRPDGTRMSNQEAADMLLRAVAALLPEQYRGVYDGRSLEEALPPTAA
jgi:1-acyl-sn-glycerol-3-phosphate acyltransferase